MVLLSSYPTSFWYTLHDDSGQGVGCIMRLVSLEHVCICCCQGLTLLLFEARARNSQA